MGRMSKEEREKKTALAKSLFVDRGETQEKIAEILGVHLNTINSWSVKGKWKELREISNLTPDRLQAEILKAMNDLLEGNEVDKLKYQTLKKMYDMYSDLAKQRGDLAQYIQGFIDVNTWLLSQGRSEDAKTVNSIHDQYVKAHI